jgi:dTDP-4-amino-4,6-dideoxygalactose transaminase
MLNTKFSPWPNYTQQEIEAVSAVMSSNQVNYWTGQEGRHFETEFAAWSGAGYAIAVANGTLALDLALHGLDIGPGDEVIVTPRSFIASVSCVVNAGAVPIFADVDARSGNLSAATICEKITSKTRAVIVVHVAGWPCNMTEIIALANAHGFKVIEDCAQANGARHAGQSVGVMGHVSAWSFCQDKIMTTGGEGGMVTTNDPVLWDKMWSFKDHGKSWDAVYNRAHAPGFRWVHESIGTNWRMLEMQSVIGRMQLKSMPQWTARRTQIAMRYASSAGKFPEALSTPMVNGDDVHAYYRYYCYVRPDGLRDGWSRDRIVAEMGELQLPLMQGSCSEIYREKAFDGTGIRPEKPLSNAVLLGETSLAFLTHPTLLDEEVEEIAQGFEAIIQQATR